MARSSSDSDSELEIPASVRVNLRRDVGMAARATSPIVTAAAKRQLRGSKGERKTAKEVAAEIRSKEVEAAAVEDSEDLPSQPASAQPRHDLVTTMDLISNALGSALEATHSHPPAPATLESTQEALDESKTSATSLAPGQKLVSIRRKGISTPGKESTSASVGIGVKFTQTMDGEHIVTSLLPGGPADLTKQVEVHDKIVAVDGELLKGKSSEQIISLIVGPPGTFVELLLEPTVPTTVGPPAKLETQPLLATPPPKAPAAAEIDSGGSPEQPAPVFASSKRSYGRAEPPAHGTPEPSLTGGGAAGVGVKFLTHSDRSVTVVEVGHGSPAEDSRRIHPQDRILLVDGAEVEGKTPAEVEQMTAGVPGSNVVLTLQSAFDKQVRSVTLHRKRGHIAEGIAASPPIHRIPSPAPALAPATAAMPPAPPPAPVEPQLPAAPAAPAPAPAPHPNEPGQGKEGEGGGGAARPAEEGRREKGSEGRLGAAPPAMMGGERGPAAAAAGRAQGMPQGMPPQGTPPPGAVAVATLARVEAGEKRMEQELQATRAKLESELHHVEHSNQRLVNELQAMHQKTQAQEKMISKLDNRIVTLEQRPQGCACTIS